MSPRRVGQALEALRAGDLARADQLAGRMLEREPGHPDALHVLGLVRLAQGRGPAALELLERAVAAAPRVALLQENLAEAYHRCGQPDRAAGACELALRLDAALPRARNLLGVLRTNEGRYGEAVEHLQKALEARPGWIDPLLNLAVVFNRTGLHDAALRCSEAALRVSPGDPRAYTNRGMALQALGRRGEAREAFERAGDHAPARFDLGYTLMLDGDLARGLPLLEARKGLLGIGRGLAAPEWDGTPRPEATLLVVHEQGLGDTLLMCRFLPEAARRVREVVALVQAPLVRLLAASFPGIRFVTALDGVRHDTWCATMSLPLALGVDAPERIPLAPWLVAGPAPPAGGRPRVGLNWAGNPRFAFDALRSTHLDTFSMLLQVGDVEWVSLHKGHLEHEAEAFGLPQPLREAVDFLDTARVVRGLDLVVSTETAIPNLSAALGVPTCVLTGPEPDWRWERWYAGVTVCRQETPGDWSAPVVRTLEVLHGLLARRVAA